MLNNSKPTTITSGLKSTETTTSTLSHVLKQSGNQPLDNNSSARIQDYHHRILANLNYRSTEDYEKKVKLLKKSLKRLPNTFDNIQTYQQAFRPYIEVASHQQILEGLQSESQNEHDGSLNIESTLWWENESIHLDEHTSLCKVELNLKQTPAKQATKINFRSSVFLLSTLTHPKTSLLCLAEPDSQTGARLLSLRFICQNTDRETIKRLFNASTTLNWHAVHITSLLDWSRYYAASFQLSNNDCVNQVITGYIPVPGLDNSATTTREENASNNEQQQFIQHAFSQDGVTVLHGPPGTGKTDTLAKLILQCVRLNLRVLVTAPSNQALGELAKRVAKEEPSRVILIGVQDKLPPELEANFQRGWYQRTQTALNELLTFIRKIQALAFEASTEELRHPSEKSSDGWSAAQQLASALERFTNQVSISNEVSEQINPDLNDLHQYRQNLSTIEPSTSINELGWLTDNTLRLLKKIERTLLRQFNAHHVNHDLLNQSGRVFFATPSSIATLNDLAFDLITIDEASLLSEVACLPVLTKPTRKLVIAGDPKQLSCMPAFQEAEHLKYNRSILTRLLDDVGATPIFLSKQYRMHRMICNWPSARFYHGKLTTAKPDTAFETYTYSGLSRPIAFFNINSPEKQVNHGYSNPDEAQLIVNLVAKLSTENSTVKIGVICFYVSQRDLVLSLLAEHATEKSQVIVSTVDGFQGAECDYIIVAGTRSKKIGFLSNDERINVAVTRAKSRLFFIGNQAILSQSSTIKSLIKYAALNNACFTQKDLVNFIGTIHAQKALATPQSSNRVIASREDAIKTWAENMVHHTNTWRTLKQQEQTQKATYTNEAFLQHDITYLQEKLNSLKSQCDEKEQSIKQIASQYTLPSSSTHATNEIEITPSKNDDLYEKIKNLESIYTLKRTVFQNKKVNFIQHNVKNHQLEIELHNKAYAAHQNAFSSLNAQDLEFIAFKTYDPMLRCATFYRLSYIAFNQEQPWQALFYALNVIYATTSTYSTLIEKMHTQVEFSHQRYILEVYRNCIFKVYSRCMNTLIERRELPNHIETFMKSKPAKKNNPTTNAPVLNYIDWVTLCSEASKDRYRMSVLTMWMIQETPENLIDLKLFAINQLSFICRHFNYSYQMEWLFAHLNKISSNLKRSDFCDEEATRVALQIKAHNMTEKVHTDFEKLFNSKDETTPLTVENSLMEIAFQIQSAVKKNIPLKRDATHWCRLIINNYNYFTHEYISGKLCSRDYMLICCQLINIYSKSNDQADYIKNMFDEVTRFQSKIRQDNQEFLLIWFKYQYAIFLLTICSEEEQAKSNQLMQEVMETMPTLFEVHAYIDLDDQEELEENSDQDKTHYQSAKSFSFFPSKEATNENANLQTMHSPDDCYTRRENHS